MADSKISALTAASAAALTNEFAINEAGVSKKLTLQKIKAGLGIYYTIPINGISPGAGGFAPGDGFTYFFGMAGNLTVTNAIRKSFFRRTGIVRAAEVNWTAISTAGSNENISIYFRLNDTTDTLIATIGDTNFTKAFSNTSLNLSISSGDFFELKVICPTWVTNPIGVHLAGYLLVEDV